MLRLAATGNVQKFLTVNSERSVRSRTVRHRSVFAFDGGCLCLLAQVLHLQNKQVVMVSTTLVSPPPSARRAPLPLGLHSRLLSGSLIRFIWANLQCLFQDRGFQRAAPPLGGARELHSGLHCWKYLWLTLMPFLSIIVSLSVYEKKTNKAHKQT